MLFYTLDLRLVPCVNLRWANKEKWIKKTCSAYEEVEVNEKLNCFVKSNAYTKIVFRYLLTRDSERTKTWFFRVPNSPMLHTDSLCNIFLSLLSLNDKTRLPTTDIPVSQGKREGDGKNMRSRKKNGKVYRHFAKFVFSPWHNMFHFNSTKCPTFRLRCSHNWCGFALCRLAKLKACCIIPIRLKAIKKDLAERKKSFAVLPEGWEVELIKNADCTSVSCTHCVSVSGEWQQF